MEMKFSELHQGDRARVIEVDPRAKHNLRLQEMGLTVGTEFTVVKVAPFGDPIEVDFRGTRLCLRKGETEGYELEMVG